MVLRLKFSILDVSHSCTTFRNSYHRYHMGATFSSVSFSNVILMPHVLVYQSLNHYVMPFFVSYYSLCFKDYFSDISISTAAF